MADTFELELATPERLVLREQVTDAQIPALNGFVGVLPGHAPMISELKAGYLTYTAAGRKFYLAVNGGFVEVLGDKVRVLARTAERADEIDIERARLAFERSQQRLAEQNPGIDISRALAASERAMARLEAAKHK